MILTSEEGVASEDGLLGRLGIGDEVADGIYAWPIKVVSAIPTKIQG